LKVLKDKTINMEEEIALKFDRVSEEQARLEELKEELKKDKEELSMAHSRISDELRAVTHENNLKKSKVNNHEVHASLAELERKTSANYQAIWSMKNYIQAKVNDLDYTPQVNELNKWVEEVNAKLCQKYK
jgi:hypothetical protein